MCRVREARGPHVRRPKALRVGVGGVALVGVRAAVVRCRVERCHGQVEVQRRGGVAARAAVKARRIGAVLASQATVVGERARHSVKTQQGDQGNQAADKQVDVGGARLGDGFFELDNIKEGRGGGFRWIV